MNLFHNPQAIEEDCATGMLPEIKVTEPHTHEVSLASDNYRIGAQKRFLGSL